MKLGSRYYDETATSPVSDVPLASVLTYASHHAAAAMIDSASEAIHETKLPTCLQLGEVGAASCCYIALKNVNTSHGLVTRLRMIDGKQDSCDLMGRGCSERVSLTTASVFFFFFFLLAVEDHVLGSS